MKTTNEITACINGQYYQKDLVMVVFNLLCYALQNFSRSRLMPITMTFPSGESKEGKFTHIKSLFDKLNEEFDIEIQYVLSYSGDDVTAYCIHDGCLFCLLADDVLCELWESEVGEDGEVEQEGALYCLYLYKEDINAPEIFGFLLEELCEIGSVCEEDDFSNVEFACSEIDQSRFKKIEMDENDWGWDLSMGHKLK